MLAPDPHEPAALVARFEPALRAVTRVHRLSRHDADDVIQATWLAYLEHGHTVREPAALMGWLQTTARRQCLRLLRATVRERPTEEPAPAPPAPAGDPHADLLAAERRAALLDALAELPLPRRRLMTLLVARPGLTYEEVGAALDMPIGSIGPTRQRALASLRRSARLLALRAEPGLTPPARCARGRPC